MFHLNLPEPRANSAVSTDVYTPRISQKLEAKFCLSTKVAELVYLSPAAERCAVRLVS
jgi:hypothetical protein